MQMPYSKIAIILVCALGAFKVSLGAVGGQVENFMRPVPQWVMNLYQEEFVNYEFRLPSVTKKTHPRLPYPSDKALKYYRENIKPGSSEYKRIARDPLLMYVITKDRKYFDKVIGWIKSPPNDSDKPYYRIGRILDWLYDELPNGLRERLAEECARSSIQYFKISQKDLAPTQTWFLNRIGNRGMECAIASWNESLKGDEALKLYHRRFFRDMVPLWHLAMGQKDGGGFSIPAGWYSHSIQSVIVEGMTLWSSFLGEDLFKKYESWLKPYGYEPFFLYQPNMAAAPLGDSGSGLHDISLNHTLVFADRYDDPYMRWLAYSFKSGREEMPQRPFFIKSEYGQYYEIDTTGKETRHPKNSFPAERFLGEGFGLVAMRSDWTEDATYALFKVGDITTNHTHNDSGMFYIYRNGSLTGDTGLLRFGDKVYDFPHYKGYTSLAVAHNVVTVRDPEDKFVPNEGGQRAVSSNWHGSPVDIEHYINENEVYETGDMLAYDPQEEYVYAAGDLTAAYQNSQSGKDTRPRPDEIKKQHLHRTRRLEAMTRAFLYIRPDYFAIFDRVVSLKPEFEKKWLLHVPHKPNVAGNTIEVERNGKLNSKYPAQIQVIRYKTSRDERSRQYPLHGKLYSKTLLPIDYKLEVVGGAGKEFLSDDKSYNAGGQIRADPSSVRDLFGWRIEVSPKNQRKEDYFLHVIQVGDSKELQKMVPVEYYEAKGMVGFKMIANGGTYTVLFDKSDGIGGHITFQKEGRNIIDRDFAEGLNKNRQPARGLSHEVLMPTVN